MKISELISKESKSGYTVVPIEVLTFRVQKVDYLIPNDSLTFKTYQVDLIDGVIGEKIVHQAFIDFDEMLNIDDEVYCDPDELSMYEVNDELLEYLRKLIPASSLIFVKKKDLEFY